MNKDYLVKLLEILNSNISNEEKKKQILQYHESDIADLLDALDDDKREQLYQILGTENIAEVMVYSDDVSEILEDFEPSEAADLIEILDVDDAIDVLEELDEESRNQIINLLDKEVVEDIKAIKKYDDDMIGSKMTNNFITVLNNDSVKSAMKKVITDAAVNDNVSTIYVIDQNDKLYGVIDLRDLIIAREGTNLETIVKKNYPTINAKTIVSDCINELIEYGLDSYPIVDDDEKLIGVITTEDIIEVASDELADDYAKFAGLTEEEEDDETVISSVKKRLPWLLVLLVLGLLQSFLMTGFEYVVAALPIIVFFQTLVLDMSGNTGTQSLAVTIRMISNTKDVEEKKRLFKPVFKELRVGFLNGFVLAVLSFVFVFLFLKFTNQGVTSETFDVFEALKSAGIVGLSLMVSMTVSSIVGTVIPILFKKINIDPAVASGPLITTINDVISLFIYYGLLILLFSLMM